MKNNIIDVVEEVLKQNEKYVSEDGKLLKTNVYSDVMTMNEDLIKLLLSNSKIKEKFFVKVSDNGYFEIHIDKDDANCFLLKTGDEVIIEK